MTSESTSTDARLGSGDMFDQIAGRYDLLNRLMSVGVDQSWRRKTVKALALPDGPSRVLDLATGTADLALRIATTHTNADVVGVDPSNGMLEVGRQKVSDAKLCERISLLQGAAETLDFDDNVFNATCIAFGIRNVVDRSRGLREMARVTKVGGRIAILELNEPKQGLLSPFARFHIRNIVPRVGGMISGSKEYRYLQESIAAFPAPDVFAEQMSDCGLRVVDVQPLTFGVCTLFVAESLEAAR